MNTLEWTFVIAAAICAPILVCCLCCFVCNCRMDRKERKQVARQSRLHHQQKVSKPNRPIIRSNSSGSQGSLNVAIFNRDVVLQMTPSSSAISSVKSGAFDSNITSSSRGSQESRIYRAVQITELSSTANEVKSAGIQKERPYIAEYKSAIELSNGRSNRVRHGEHSRESRRSKQRRKLQNFNSMPNKLMEQQQPFATHSVRFNNRSLRNYAVNRESHLPVGPMKQSNQNRSRQLRFEEDQENIDSETGQLLNYRMA